MLSCRSFFFTKRLLFYSFVFCLLFSTFSTSKRKSSENSWKPTYLSPFPFKQDLTILSYRQCIVNENNLAELVDMVHVHFYLRFKLCWFVLASCSDKTKANNDPFGALFSAPKLNSYSKFINHHQIYEI